MKSGNGTYCSQYFLFALKTFDVIMYTGCGIHNESAHVKVYYSLNSDLMVTKFHMGLLPTLMDKIMHNNFGPASIWPQERLSSQVSHKCIEPTLKWQKKKNFCCMFIQNFLHFRSKIQVYSVFSRKQAPFFKQ